MFCMKMPLGKTGMLYGGSRLQSNLVYGSNGVRPGAREHLEYWRVLPRDGGPTDTVVKVLEAIYLY